MPGVVRRVIEGAQAETDAPGRVLAASGPRTWAKGVHLIGLPLLDATRPWQLRYALGDGLVGVCRIAYRFDTINRALGELKHLHLGDALRQTVYRSWVRTLAGTDGPLHMSVEAHLKPHWTHRFMPCGHRPLLDRVMPCPRPVIVPNPQGYVGEILDRVGEAALSQALPGREPARERLTRHPVTLTVVARAANSLALAHIDAQSDQCALLTLRDDPVSADRQAGTPALADVFRLTGRWQPLATQPGRALAPARWAPARAGPDAPRVFWLVRDEARDTLGAVDSLSPPVTACAPDAAARGHGRGAREGDRQRWLATENVIRAMVAGGNLKAHSGQARPAVPRRLRQRPAEAAQAQVATPENPLATTQRPLATLRVQQAERERTLTEQLADVTLARPEREAEGKARQPAGRATRRVEQPLAHLDRAVPTLTPRHARRTARFEARTRDLTARQADLETQRAQRQAALAAIALTQPRYERDLETDQIMAEFQAALLNAHRWWCAHDFTGAWSHRELETAIARIYRQRGRVVYTAQRVEVTRAAFGYRAEHALAEAACARFNAARVHDAAGRLIVMAVAPFHHGVNQL